MWEIAQQEREVLCKCEDRSQIPRTHISTRCACWVTCDPVLYSSNKLTRARWPARLAKWHALVSSGRPHVCVQGGKQSTSTYMYTHIYTWEHACMPAHTTYIPKKSSRVNKMVWWVKLFVARLDHLNWNPWSHMTEKVNQPLQTILWPPNAQHGAHPPSTHTY